MGLEAPGSAAGGLMRDDGTEPSTVPGMGRWLISQLCEWRGEILFPWQLHDLCISSSYSHTRAVREEGSRRQQKAAKAAIQRGLQSRVSAAQLMFIENGIYSWARARVAHFNNTKQITQKYQHTHTPFKKVFTVNFTRSWLNCWKNVEMKSHFWNISSCLETFWCITSSILFNLEALCRPRLRDWMRKFSTGMSRNIAGYLLGKHLSIPNESSLRPSIERCRLPVRPNRIVLSELIICQNVPMKQREVCFGGWGVPNFLSKLWLNKWICLLVSNAARWVNRGGNFLFSLISVATRRLCCFWE